MTRLSFSIVGVLLFAGCAGTITTTDGRQLRLDSAEFQGYVERVFREQNQTATALAFAQDAATGGRYERLLELEDALLEACAALNTLASARRDERTLGLRAQARMARTAPDCEAAAQRAQADLETF